ncbi:MAG: YdcF family protein [Bacteroidota bacterium]
MKRFLSFRIGINVGIIILMLFLFTLIFRSAGSFLVREDTLYKADAAIILMGSITDRVLQAADLYHEGYFDKLILVEENMGQVEALVIRGARLISNTAQCRQAAVDLGIPDSCITVLPGRATSTQIEALITREYLSGHPEIKSLLIISSASHTRRAGMIFKKVMNKGHATDILTSPSIYSSFRAQKWWRYRESRQDVVYEYIKLLNFLLIDQFRISKN